MITRATYEEYFLDYHAGALDAAQKEELFLFLDQNPDLREEFESFVELKLEPEPGIFFRDKEKLQRHTIHEHNYLSWLLAYMEGDISDSDKREVEDYIKSHPLAEKELIALKRTRILPDQEIYFAEISSLKRSPVIIPLKSIKYFGLAIAASLLILLLFYPLLFQKKTESGFAEDKIIPLERMHEHQESATPLLADIAVPEKENIATPENKVHASSYPQRKSESDKLNPPVIEPIHEELISPAELIVLKVEPELPGNAPTEFQQHEITLVPESEIAMKASEKSNHDLRSVFSEEELAELGVSERKAGDTKNSNAWELAEAGVRQLQKATGANVELEKRVNDVANATTYALEIGKFSFSRTKLK